ncbi:MAG TPA: SdpI family protein [Labilithrix sp.]|nr:SdpI family protein [Labilithrix sp.]
MKAKFGAKFEQSDLVALSVIAGTAALTGALYARLPERIPRHFDIHGVADGWTSRSLGAWLLPLTAVGLWILLRPGALLLPSAWRARMDQSPTAQVTALVAILMSSLQCVMLYSALQQPESVGTLHGLLLGAFWLGLGLILPRVRRNPWMGVRTPWTLSSDENWARTHRIAGYTFVIAGALAVLGTLITQSAALGIALILASGLIPVVYSFLLARRLPPEA